MYIVVVFKHIRDIVFMTDSFGIFTCIPHDLLYEDIKSFVDRETKDTTIFSKEGFSTSEFETMLQIEDIISHFYKNI